MSKPNESRGGAIAIRGLLVQTIVALLDITKADPPFTEITLEPVVCKDQFDFLWLDAPGSHAIQVKSTENSFTKADVERWAGKLKQARTDEHCRLACREYPSFACQANIRRRSGNRDQESQPRRSRGAGRASRSSFS